MKRRLCGSFLGLVITAVSLTPAPVAAQAPPRTPWGEPDLQGIWDFATITPM